MTTKEKKQKRYLDLTCANADKLNALEIEKNDRSKCTTNASQKKMKVPEQHFMKLKADAGLGSVSESAFAQKPKSQHR